MSQKMVRELKPTMMQCQCVQQFVRSAALMAEDFKIMRSFSQT